MKVKKGGQFPFYNFFFRMKWHGFPSAMRFNSLAPNCHAKESEKKQSENGKTGTKIKSQAGRRIASNLKEKK